MKKKKSFGYQKYIRNFSLVFLLIGFTLTAKAQVTDSSSTAKPKETASSPTTNNKWSFLVEPYVMFPYMKGSVGLGNLPDASLDADPHDIFSRLQFGAMLYLEADKGKWDFNTDVLYMNLKQDVSAGTVITGGEIRAKQLGWEVAVLYKVTPWLEFGLGGLLNSINSEGDITLKGILGDTQTKSGEITETWFDPMFIAKIRNMPGKKFVYSLRAEIGGTDGGTNLAWQVQAYAGYQFSKLFQLTGGYRIIGLDYDKGSGSDRFLYDVNTFGPVIRFGFNF